MLCLYIKVCVLTVHFSWSRSYSKSWNINVKEWDCECLINFNEVVIRETVKSINQTQVELQTGGPVAREGFCFTMGFINPTKVVITLIAVFGNIRHRHLSEVVPGVRAYQCHKHCHCHLMEVSIVAGHSLAQFYEALLCYWCKVGEVRRQIVS